MSERLISTSALGVLGNFRDFPRVVASDYLKKFDGFEMIGWNGRVGRMLLEAKDLGHNIFCIHGQIGPEGGNPISYLKSKALQYALVQTEDLVVGFNRTHEILIHELALRDPILRKRVYECAPGGKIIWIENPIGGLEAVQVSVQDVVKLREVGIDARFMFDWAHYLYPKLKSKDLKKSWDKILAIFAPGGFLYKPIVPIGFHLEFGNTGDSLKDISDDMMRDIQAQIESTNVSRVVLELHPGNRRRMFGPIRFGQDNVLRTNNGHIERLSKASIF